MGDPASAETLEKGMILMGLAGGLALFLYGLEQLTQALKTIAGGSMKALLARMTTSRLRAAFTGAFVTAAVQSSSVTTVLVVGFISAGLMTLEQSIGVIMGANVGSTVTAQVIAFKVTQYALVMVAAGFALRVLAKREMIRRYGTMIFGLGLLFFGMELMSQATYPLRSYAPFIDLMRQMNNPLWGILVGAGFTAIVQSSGATTGIVIVLASQGFVTLEAGIAMAFGANIGTCATALLASMGQPREAVQAAAVHVLFNVVGVFVWVFFIDQLALVVRYISPIHAELEGMAALAAETPRQIANAHTAFNIGNTLLFIGFTTPLAWAVRRLVPIKPVEEPRVLKPKYLDESMLLSPALALENVRLELGRLGGCALRMVKESPDAVMSGSIAAVDGIESMDDDVDSLHEGIVAFLGRLSRQELTEEQTELISDYLGVANYIENIGDMVETNMVALGRERLASGFHISPATQEAFKPLHAKVIWTIEQSLLAFSSAGENLAKSVIDAKTEIDQMVREVHKHLMGRLGADEEQRLVAYRIESEIIEVLRRLYYFAKQIAKTTVEERAGA